MFIRLFDKSGRTGKIAILASTILLLIGGLTALF
ncbi:hypothetical protein DFO70_10687 [Cytobacillus firmus]|uniref:Uncharacterized protein n=2 Tax=Cytobacillus TaxID=2675230 RepID=A0A366JV03_CYTFI|nr:hypothetical protein DFO70_10687 [Cytobacillus firmus]TDX42560.1 hypothetical protein DFO72_10687 [Cytobacillus oceanisediminis]